MGRLVSAGLVLLPAVLATRLEAAPNLASARPIGGLTVYSDDRQAGLFYYGPGELGLAHGAEGRPDFHFLQLRYTGSAARGDRGTLLYRSLLGFRVSMNAPSASQLSSARQALAGAGRAVELRPLPIHRLEAGLVYAPLGASEEAAAALPDGHFEGDADPAPGAASAFWTTRSFALALDPQSSELFWGALTRGQVVLSLSYAFYAKGGAPTVSERLVGPTKAVNELRRILAQRGIDETPKAGEARDQLVRAGAFSIGVDARRWPDLFRRVDVNERVPPGYPLLDIYCYDFGAESHPTLYEKQVEIEAEGVAGGRVRAGVRFGRDQPDLYAHSLRFGLAVRLDRPYRYRTTEVGADGSSVATPWRERVSWVELLDVTTPAEPGAGPAQGDRAGAEEP